MKILKKLMDEVSVIIGMDDIPTIETPDQIDIISRSINKNINKPKDISPTGVADIDKITGGGLSDTERNLLNDLKNYFDPRYDQSFISQNDLDNLNFDSLSIEKLNQTHQIAIESNFINKTINVDENGVFVEENLNLVIYIICLLPTKRKTQHLKNLYLLILIYSIIKKKVFYINFIKHIANYILSLMKILSMLRVFEHF